MTPATLKLKDVPKDPESSKAAVTQAKALASPSQEPVVTASGSHGEDDKLAKTPAPTPEVKET